MLRYQHLIRFFSFSLLILSMGCSEFSDPGVDVPDVPDADVTHSEVIEALLVSNKQSHAALYTSLLTANAEFYEALREEVRNKDRLRHGTLRSPLEIDYERFLRAAIGSYVGETVAFSTRVFATGDDWVRLKTMPEQRFFLYLGVGHVLGDFCRGQTYNFKAVRIVLFVNTKGIPEDVAAEMDMPSELEIISGYLH